MKLSLQFNQTRDNINVLYSGKKIGILILKIMNNIIIVDQIKIDKIDKIELHIIFILMDILAAYYAPTNLQCALHCDDKILEYIAYELQFVKSHPFDDKKEYFVKNCR
jgi:hypothetical protein